MLFSEKGIARTMSWWGMRLGTAGMVVDNGVYYYPDLVKHRDVPCRFPANEVQQAGHGEYEWAWQE